MRKLYATCFAAVLAGAALTVTAAELTPQERTDMRMRAEGLQSERQRGPAVAAGERRLNDAPGELRLDRDRGEVKTKAKDGVKVKRTMGKREVKRSALRRNDGKLPRDR